MRARHDASELPAALGLATGSGVAASPGLSFWRSGVWTLSTWTTHRLIAGITDRTATLEQLVARLTPPDGVLQAEQVHGASVAMIASPGSNGLIAGCDALVTNMRGVLLVIRTADCLPLLVHDPIRGIIGLAHVGWRGLVRRLPQRLLGVLRRHYRADVDALHLAIGPCIRPCCYEVGDSFRQWAQPFIRQTGGRVVCDLVGWATHQLIEAGVAPVRILDVQRCTSCEAQWYSTRRDGASTGRLFSFMMLRA